MSRIRKQPRRSNKKVCHPVVRNIFGTNDDYDSVLPIALYEKIKLVE
jgi:hypothetical protein